MLPEIAPRQIPTVSRAAATRSSGGLSPEKENKIFSTVSNDDGPDRTKPITEYQRLRQKVGHRSFHTFIRLFDWIVPPIPPACQATANRPVSGLRYSRAGFYGPCDSLHVIMALSSGVIVAILFAGIFEGRFGGK